jgi:6-pyruvoyltetrahydropterin/6-carboxytetrahydropterin synthase
MSKIRVTKEFDFEMAHALWNYDGACRNIHGHSYRLFVTVSGEPVTDHHHPKLGMVLDFTDLKEIVNQSVVDYLDHSLVVYRESEGEALSRVKDLYHKVHVVKFQPTCENLVLYIIDKIKPRLPSGISLQAVKLYETASSFAEWRAEDNN